MEILNKPSLYALLLIVPSSLLLAGCYEEFDPQIDQDPVLCVNSTITAGQPVEVRVTQTWYYSTQYTGNFDRDITVRDAVVELYADGELMETLKYSDEGGRLTYRGKYQPQPGQTIAIEARSKKFGDARGEVTVPEIPVVGRMTYDATSTASSITEVDDKYIGFKGDVFSLDFALDMTVPIDGGEGTDYYSISMTGRGGSDNGWPDSFSLWGFRYDAEPLFSEHISVIESVFGAEPEEYAFFTSRSFAGRTYPLRLFFNNGSYRAYILPDTDATERGCTVGVSVAAVSKSYYNHVLYSWKIDNGIAGMLGDVGYAEEMPGYSNVSTRAGVISARTVVSQEVDLSGFIDEQYEKALRD